MARTIDVVVVEDDPNVLTEVSEALTSAEGLALRGAFRTSAAALRWLGEGGEAHCALVDLGLPDGDGVSVIRALRSRLPGCVVLVFSVFDDDEHLFPALQAGAHGYLLKDASPEELSAAIAEAAAGGSPLSPALARRVVRQLWTQPAEGPVLTGRELELLTLLCEGASYENAAARLGISLSTTQTHVKNLYRKLRVSSKVEAVGEAVRRGLFRP